MLSTLNVSTMFDVVDENDGVLSLREAIIFANSNFEDDIIHLQIGEHEMELDGGGENESATGDFDITSDDGQALVIVGKGSALTTINARSLDRIFELHSRSNLTLRDLTIENGQVAHLDLADQLGGGIRATEAILTLDHVTVRSNNAGITGQGGGIYLQNSDYSILNSNIESNIALENGGALLARGSDGFIFLSVITDNQTHEPFHKDTIKRNSGTVAIRGGSLDIQRTRIDFNHDANGIYTSNARLDTWHIRILESDGNIGGTLNDVQLYNHAIYMLNSEGEIDDSYLTSTYGAGIAFDNPTGALTVTDTNFRFQRVYGMLFDGANLTVSGITSTETANTIRAQLSDTTEQRNVDFDFSGQLEMIPEISIAGFGTQTTVTVSGGRLEELNASFVSELIVDGVEFDSSSLNLDQVKILNTKVNVGLRANVNTADIENSEIANVLFTKDGGVARISNSNFENGNQIALHWQLSDGLLLVFDSVFANYHHDFASTTYPRGVMLIAGTQNVVAISGSRFSGNTSEPDQENSAISLVGNSHTVTVANSLFNDNHGRAIYSRAPNSSVTVLSSTFARHTTGLNAGAIYAETFAGMTLIVRNSISIGSGTDTSSEASHFANDNGTIEVFDSLIYDFVPDDGNVMFGGTANGNIDSKPRFVDYLGNNFRLRAISPAIDAGDSDGAYIDEFDLDSNGDATEVLVDKDLLNRIEGTNIDMGAYEFRVIE